MNRQEKAAAFKDINERFCKANAAAIAEYRGLTVEEVTNLRRSLREANAEFKISKNRLTRLALKEGDAAKFADFDEQLKGPLGLVFMYGDVALTAKNLLKFEKEHDKFDVKSAVFDGKVVSKAEMKAISDLPPMEVLLGQIVGALKSPHRGLVMTLAGVTRQLVQVINAIKDTKQA